MQEAVAGEAGKKGGAEKRVKAAVDEKDEKKSLPLTERVKRQLCVWLVAGPTRQV